MPVIARAFHGLTGRGWGAMFRHPVRVVERSCWIGGELGWRRWVMWRGRG